MVFEVTNTHDSGQGSLRQTVADFMQNQDWAFGVGIFFKVPNIDSIVITLESDIVIEDGQGWIGSNTYGNKTVTITGNGKLMVKSSQVRVAENIKYRFQPKSLLELAAYAVANLVCLRQWQIQFLSGELKELIHKVKQQKILIHSGS